MSKKDKFVVKDGKKWSVKSEGEVKSTHDTQADAIKKATADAKRDGAEVSIQGRDGKWREKNSYGNDPRKTKG